MMQRRKQGWLKTKIQATSDKVENNQMAASVQSTSQTISATLSQHPNPLVIRNDNYDEVFFSAEGIFKTKDYIEITPVEKSSERIIIRVQQNFYKAPAVPTSKKVLSIVKSLFEAHPAFKLNQQVNIRVIDVLELDVNEDNKSKLLADTVEIAFKDQHVTRRDMFQLCQYMDMMAVYKGQIIEFEGIRARVRSLLDCDGVERLSLVVSNKITKFSFFTKSCQVQILIEVSQEMYRFDADGFIFAEKTIAFLKSYFERCKQEANTHEVGVTMYSRLYYPQASSIREFAAFATDHFGYQVTEKDFETMGAFSVSKQTRIFQDVYLKVGIITLESTRTQQWEEMLILVRQQFKNFPSLVNWQVNLPSNLHEQEIAPGILPCELCTSEKSNFLEAINVCLFNQLNDDIDQNLKTTGSQIIVVSAGVGTYRINASIRKPTKARILMGGLPIHLVCLQQQPLYHTPLFVTCCLYECPFQTKSYKLVFQNQEASPSLRRRDSMKPEHDSQYHWPEWIEISYFPSFGTIQANGCDNLLTALNKTTPSRAVYENYQQIPNGAGFVPHPSYNYIENINLEFIEPVATPQAIKSGLMQILPGQYKYESLSLSNDERQELIKQMNSYDTTAVQMTDLDMFNSVRADSEFELNEVTLESLKQVEAKFDQVNPFSHTIFEPKPRKIKVKVASPKAFGRKLSTTDLSQSINFMKAQNADDLRLSTRNDRNRNLSPNKGLNIRQSAVNGLNQSVLNQFEYNKQQSNDGLDRTDLGVSSYQRRWMQSFKKSSAVNWEQITNLSYPDHQLNQSELNKILEPFWKNLCECKLLPLTTATGYQIENRKLSDTRSYQREENYTNGKKQQLLENLCLRLTQNFQLISPKGTLDVKMSKTTMVPHFSMCFRDRYTYVCKMDSTQARVQTFFKAKDIRSTMKASFRYLLYNHHQNKFITKLSSESRLFSLTSLSNMDSVQEDIQEAIKCCVRLPQIAFVVYYKGQGSEQYEMDCFYKLQQSLFQMMTRDGVSQLNTIKNLKNLMKIKAYPSGTIRPPDQGCTVVNIEQDDLNLGQYLLEHDLSYINGSCFHLKIYWIFARGPAMRQNVVQRVLTRIKDYSNDQFDVKQISCVIKQLELNPYESSVTLRHPSQSNDFFNQAFAKYIVQNKMYVNESTDGQTQYFLEHSGATYVSLNRDTSAVQFSENDVVTNLALGYENATRLLRKIEAVVIAIDILSTLILF